MYSYLLLWVFAFHNALPVQVSNTVHIAGTCYDLKDAENLKVKVYALSKNQKTYLTESKQNGVYCAFNAHISDTTEFLSFEYPGYHTATVAVHFIGKLNSKTKFSFSMAMVSQDSMPISTGNQVVLCINASAALDYEIKSPKSTGTFGTGYYDGAHCFKPNTGWPLVHDNEAPVGEYTVKAIDKAEKLVQQETFVTKSGFNFKEINIEYPKKRVALNVPNIAPKVETKVITPPVPAVQSLPFETRNLYFELSSYELTANNKTVLDSVAAFLNHQSNQKIAITGYAENIGPREKNLTLSEFRTKTVATYLLQKGVPSQQIETAWKGADVAEKVEKNRRVLLQILPQ
jgi:outer membrane protein OmpA-like peptidoglycan-associated protein